MKRKRRFVVKEILLTKDNSFLEWGVYDSSYKGIIAWLRPPLCKFKHAQMVADDLEKEWRAEHQRDWKKRGRR